MIETLEPLPSTIEPPINRDSFAYRAGHFIGGLRKGDGSENTSYIPLATEELDTLPDSSGDNEGTLEQPETPATPEKVTMEDVQATLDQVGVQLDEEMAKLRTRIADLSAKDDRQWGLRSRVGQRTGGREFSDWGGVDSHQQSLNNAITKRYGAAGDLGVEITRLKNELNKKDFQKNYLRVGTILEFEEDVDPSLFRKYLPDPKEDLGENFHLPKNPNPTTDPIEAQKLLHTLPFVVRSQLLDPHRMEETPVITIKGNWEFPADRIIGVATFEDWSGRGDGPGSGKSFTPVNITNIEKTSRGAITDYAHTEDMSWLKESHAFGNGIDLDIVVDADGEYWGIVMGGGSHTTAAAKLRGERSIPVGTISFKSEGYMPKIPFSVKERFGGMPE